jgi:apolipoprotein N-acyltransferase
MLARLVPYSVILATLAALAHPGLWRLAALAAVLALLGLLQGLGQLARGRRRLGPAYWFGKTRAVLYWPHERADRKPHLGAPAGHPGWTRPS